jgi:chromosome transmission fidelity protein 1
MMLGERYKTCPYYASRRAIVDADLVLLPYQILFHRTTREASGIKLEGSVVIIDEAHNIIDAIQNIYSIALDRRLVSPFLDK